MAWSQGTAYLASAPVAAAPMAPPAPAVPAAPPAPAPPPPTAPQPPPARPTEASPGDLVDDDECADEAADDRVHHHARIDADGALAGTDTIRTLCGLRLPRPRPDAARMRCCPRCAAVMGGRCR